MIELPPNHSKVAVHDIFDPLPLFMLEARCLIVDIPYNQSLLANYSNRPDVTLSHRNPGRFAAFVNRLFECTDEISPSECFVETGREALADIIIEIRRRFPKWTFYNSMYYGRRNNRCYVVHGSHAKRFRRLNNLDDMDEAKVIEWLCHNVDAAECVGDLCMGRGLVGWHAYRAGRRFVGTELNPKRLAVLVDRIHKAEAKHHAQR